MGNIAEERLKNLQGIRLCYGLTQLQCAEFANCSLRAWQAYEAKEGKNKRSMPFLRRQEFKRNLEKYLTFKGGLK